MSDEQELQTHREYAEQQWLVLKYRNNREIRVNARALDRILADGHRLILDVYDYAVAVHVKSGPDVAALIVEQLQKYTRSAPIHDSVSYMLAKQRLAGMHRREAWPVEPILFLGGVEMVVRENLLWIGDESCSFDVLYEGTINGDLLWLSNGDAIQSELALIVFAHQRRVEDLDLLAKRVAEYEHQRRDGE
jgi:hypothetical protein